MKILLPNLNSLIPSIRNIGILHHKKAELRILLQHSVCNYKPNTATVDETVEILVDAVFPIYEAPGLKKTGVPPLPGDDEFVLKIEL